MNRQERSADPRDGADALLDGIADVVQLEVDENLFALANELPGKFETARISELVADLVECPGISDPSHKSARFIDGGEIEADDELVAHVRCRRGINGKGHCGPHGVLTLL